MTSLALISVVVSAILLALALVYWRLGVNAIREAQWRQKDAELMLREAQTLNANAKILLDDSQ